MSQPRVSLWATEEIDEDLQVDVNLAIGNYGQNGLYDDAQPRIDEATLVAVQHQMAQQAAFAQIPDAVKRFIVHFHQAVLENNLAEITVAYESGWNRLTEKFYSKTEWPEAEVIAPLVNDDQLFLILYRELYYRHVYSRLQPDIDDRFHSYENSCELFNYLLNSEDGPVSLQLPEQWLWDIVDEFIYQFQSFYVWRAKVKTKTEEELVMLADGSQVWSAYSVLNVLYSLIQKSKINEFIIAQQHSKSEAEIAEIVGDYGSLPLYHMLGYFSLIGLLRVHVLLGDFTLALKVVENVELNQKKSFHSRYCLPRRNVLLRGILLYHATPLPRRDPRLRADPKFHTSNAAISHTKLPVRPDQQDGRSHVRIVRHLQCPVTESIGRQYPQHCQRPLRRPIRQAVPGRGRPACVRRALSLRVPQVHLRQSATVR